MESPPNASQIYARIERRLAKLGKSERGAAVEAKLSDSAIRNIKEGKSSSPRLDTVWKLAPVLETTVEWLAFGIGPEETGQSTVDRTNPPQQLTSEIDPSNSKLVPVPIIGPVEAGAFREAPEYERDDLQYIAEPPDREFPHARMIGFDVSGDSMNDLKPRPLLPGDRVIGLDFHDIDSQVILRDGMVVVIEQTRDGGHTREWSVKQLEIHEDRYEFHPRSTNKRHKPIVVPNKVFRDPSEDDGRQVRILALVRRVTTNLTF
jgi:transcriptional regulator with XRE-family HTH domain